jgi:ElaB/YqjD/DUF883 family membrane-anchored ribosome-binding protein
MQNDTTERIDEKLEDLNETTQEWKSKARAAGSAAMDATRAGCQQLQDKTIEYSKATDKAIRENPYVALGCAFGAGLLLGLLMMRGGESED